jgi:predicted ATPase/DNA-binding SARP family transcriptional activator/tetratricopeptide (TPR) repeat protein
LTDLRLYFLGAPRIEREGAAVGTDRRKAVALLAYLALTAVPHSRDSLAARFWPESDQSSALAYLRRTLWELNQMLGPGPIAADREQVAFVGGDGLWLDVAEFRRLAGQSGATALAKAAALYGGEFLAGFNLRDAPEFDTWQYETAESLRRQLAQTLQTLSAHHGETGEGETAVSYARRWLNLDPLDEAPHRQLMRLYAGMGQRGAALRQYEQCLALLEEELGAKPAPETIALYDAIRAGELAALPAPSDPMMSPLLDGETTAVCHNLPAQLTHFVGRGHELAEIRRLFTADDCRLLTLLGPGGSGKSRLALQLATQFVEQEPERFADGVYFVPLASLASPEQIPAALAFAMQFTARRDEQPLRQQIIEFLRFKQILLALDNYEHLLAGDGPLFLADMLAAAPRLKILTTSRLRLNVQGEQLYLVPGMHLPDMATAVAWQQPADAEGYSAIQLFTQTARRADPNFRLTTENVLDVVRICHLVDGLPLGIELAAGWLALLSPAEIAEEIARSLDFLETEQRDVPERQRSLRSVFNYTWDLLSEAERRIFARLSIFSGGFSREAAQAVAGAGLRDLMGLVTKSLLWRGENGRYQVHELLRQYAHERLAADPDLSAQTRDHFIAYFTEFLQAQGEQLKGSGQEAAITLLELDEENCRLAWQWAAQGGDFARVLAGLEGLILFYVSRSIYASLGLLLREGLAAVETAVASTPATPLARRALLSLLAARAWSLADDISSQEPREMARRAMQLVVAEGAQRDLGILYALLSMSYTWHVDINEGLNHFRHGLSLSRESGDPFAIALFLDMLGGTLSTFDPDEARQCLNEAIAITRRLDCSLLLARNLQTLAQIEAINRQYEKAFRLLEECQEIYLRLNAGRGAAHVRYDMADISVSNGQFREALDWYESAKALFVQVGDRQAVAHTQSWQSIVATRLGDFALAEQWREISHATLTQILDEGGLAWSLWEWGELRRLQGQTEAARDLYERSLVRFQQHGISLGLVYYHRGLGDLALMRQDWPTARAHYDQALEALQDTYHPWGQGYIYTHYGLAQIAQGELEAARQSYREAVHYVMVLGDKGVTLMALYGVTNLLAAEGDLAGAAGLAAFVQFHLAAWWETRERARRFLAELSSQLAPDAFAEARLARQEMSLNEVIEEVKGMLAIDN